MHYPHEKKLDDIFQAFGLFSNNVLSGPFILTLKGFYKYIMIYDFLLLLCDFCLPKCVSMHQPFSLTLYSSVHLFACPIYVWFCFYFILFYLFFLFVFNMTACFLMRESKKKSVFWSVRMSGGSGRS